MVTDQAKLFMATMIERTLIRVALDVGPKGWIEGEETEVKVKIPKILKEPIQELSDILGTEEILNHLIQHLIFQGLKKEAKEFDEDELTEGIDIIRKMKGSSKCQETKHK